MTDRGLNGTNTHTLYPRRVYTRAREPRGSAGAVKTTWSRETSITYPTTCTSPAA